MNCLEFRRRLRSDMDVEDPDFAAHRRACAPCRRAVAHHADWERRLGVAARIDAPGDLASKILLRQALAERGPRRHVWTLAAALALATGLGALAALQAPRWLHEPDADLQHAVIEVIAKETYALAATGPVAAAGMDAALTHIGVSFEHDIGGVRFAEPCWVRGKIAAHLVVTGGSIPITVFLMPHERVERREDFRIGHLSGVLLPSAGGTIAIVGAPGADLAPIEARVTREVRWRA